jgi:hypothetical protein
MPSVRFIFNGNRRRGFIGRAEGESMNNLRKSHVMTRVEMNMDKPYCDDLKGVLAFSNLTETEGTIRSLEKLCRKYVEASDKKGVEYCRKVALLGRRRAEYISRNKRVTLQKRLEKKEIAEWFRIWLETPGLFEDWLAMRKKTAEFKKLL